MTDEPLPTSKPSGASKRKRELAETARKPWDRTPWPDDGDPEQNATYAAVGAALSQWALFEVVLGRLFEAFITLDLASDAGRRAFEAVRTFESRSSMLRAAGQSYFASFHNKQVNSDFDELLKAAKNYSERRNEIAHGAVKPFPTLKASPAPAISGYALMPSAYDPYKATVWGGIKYAYTSKEMQEYASHFATLVDPANMISLHIVQHTQALRRGDRKPWPE